MLDRVDCHSLFPMSVAITSETSAAIRSRLNLYLNRGPLPFEPPLPACLTLDVLHYLQLDPTLGSRISELAGFTTHLRESRREVL